jgi:uncharacterized protein
MRYNLLVDGRAELPGALLHEARSRAGLSQTQLARRAGVPQSMISLYESGARQPAVPTLAALIEAAGSDLHLSLRRRGLNRLSGPVGQQVRRHRAQLVRTARSHGVRVHGVFGSVARGEDRPDSDVDLLVELPDGIGLLGIAGIQHELEQLVHAPVELIPVTDLKAGVRQQAFADLVPL